MRKYLYLFFRDYSFHSDTSTAAVGPLGISLLSITSTLIPVNANRTAKAKTAFNDLKHGEKCRI
jgi:hypothetical protein